MSSPETSTSGTSSQASSSAAASHSTPPASDAAASGNWRARYARFRGTRTYRSYAFVSKHRRRFLFGASVLYLGTSYVRAALAARKRDRVHDDTYLYWKIYDGSIVEAKSSATTIRNLLFSNSGGGSDEPARVMTLFEVVKGLNYAMRDDRVKGIVADFSSLSAPAVQTAYSLGLAQIEEISDALDELNHYKAERLGAENWRSIAFTDSFESQAQYTLASAFNEIYMQPTGEVPLTGIGSQIPFFRRLIDWLGVKVQAEAREEYKSFIAQYTSERLSDPQTKNQQELIESLNDLMLERIARNRFERVVPQVVGDSLMLPVANVEDVRINVDQAVLASSPLEAGEADTSHPDNSEQIAESSDASPSETEDGEATRATVLKAPTSSEVVVDAHTEAFQRLKKLTFDGPFSSREAVEAGLITGQSYRSYIMDSIREPEAGGREENHLMGFYHYCKVMERAAQRAKEPALEIGVVYLLGTIGESGEYDAGSVVRGLRQAGEDEDIGCVVLRIDSGGGGVVDSDSIDQAVRDLKEKKGKVVVASFSNSAASGGYMSACHADAIMAHPSTMTGSIGVAALRPVFAPSFLDKIKVSVQSLFTGSQYNDQTQELTGSQLEKYRRHVDEMYADFKNRVVEGREIHPDLINYLAGGRVYTGQMAFDLLAEANRDNPPAEDLPGTIRLPHSTATTGASEESSAAGVQMPEDQEMSPYAPPEMEAGTVPDLAQAGAVATNEQHQQQYMPLGPMGRGIVDGLGGIRDAAALATEIFLTRAFAEAKLDNPGLSDEQIARDVLPGVQCQLSETGQLVVPLDIDLKQFPVEKSFWQLYKEASTKGDAMTDPSASGSVFQLPQIFKAAFASWVLSAAAKVLSEEMDSLGLADVRRGMGIGSKSRGRAYMRAEAPRITTK